MTLCDARARIVINRGELVLDATCFLNDGHVGEHEQNLGTHRVSFLRWDCGHPARTSP